jgi:hypothetical protein
VIAMKKNKYSREALKAGLTDEDLEIIKAIGDYDNSEFDELCLQLGLPDDNSVVKEIIQIKDH